jgi:hypothetical protein
MSTANSTPEAGIELLRRVVKWADWQREDHWLPEDGQEPTIDQIVQLHALCLSWDVETPEDLASHDDPRARAAWTTWHANRGNQTRPANPPVALYDGWYETEFRTEFLNDCQKCPELGECQECGNVY